MLITHDMGVVAEMADKIMVMYAGKEMEYGDVRSIFKDPLHPYTRGLLKSIPRLDQSSDDPLFNIPGSVPDLSEMPKDAVSAPDVRKQTNDAGSRSRGFTM